MAACKIFNNLLPKQRFVTQKETPKCFAWKMASQSETKEIWISLDTSAAWYSFKNVILFHQTLSYYQCVLKMWAEKSAHCRKAKQSYSSKKSCYQCVLKMWAHLISLGSVWCSRCFSSSKEPDYLMTLGETKQRIQHSGVACFLFINYHSQSLIS